MSSQYVVDAPAQFAFDGIADAVIEKCILFRFVRMMIPENIRQTPGKYALVCIPYLRVEGYMSQDPFGIVDIDLFRRDVEVAAQNKRLVRVKTAQ